MSYKVTQNRQISTNNQWLFAVLLAIISFTAMFSCKGKNKRTLIDDLTLEYPFVQRDSSVVEDYFGVNVPDPYRWLEEPNSEKTRQWVRAQNTLTYNYLDQIPFRDAVHNRLEEVWNFERYGLPEKKNNKFYFYKNNGLQNQDVLYVQDGGANSKPKLLLDPNKFSKDGTTAIDVQTARFSNDGEYYAFGIVEAGSDWRKILVFDVDKKRVLRDTVHWAKFTNIAWHGRGYYYSRYAEPKKGEEHSQKNEFQQVFYHNLGTPQSSDVLVFADRRYPQRNFSATTTSDERFLIISGSESTSGNSLYFKDLLKEEPDDSFSPIVEDFEHDHQIIDNFGSKLLILTNYKAPNNRLVFVDVEKPEPEHWQDVVAEKTNVLTDAKLIGGRILATYIENASSRLKVFSMQGEHLSDVTLPSLGTVQGVKGSKDDARAFFSFVSFTRPSTIFEYNIAKNESKVFKSSNINFKSDDYETKQIIYESYDGTKIPMFVTHKKGLQLQGNCPTLLYGYGGFDISILPNFRPENTVLLENGGVYAVANIRGGGEFGKEWHKAGTLERKQNVFNDFQAAAEYLIKNNYTSSQKLAIEGRSNGGLLVGACMTQRPDLFKVALPTVGVMDMLRYHKFTIGWAWATDYGTSEKSEQFKYLYAYSPLHNVKATTYPATLIMTADHDDRVVPAHSYKFASELQYKNESNNPILIRIDTSAGHGAGKPTTKKIEEWVDIVSFTLFNLGIRPYH